ncbi:MAG: formyltetrahydrofolate deformylase [Nitrososphaeria archaeon]|nr:formyltetrahydrofolate deformylase [Nitrososphaeria archaeon]NDB50893.1 formyltetrahydrofolate deformylase [Nitrosopumilaceae archaeon]NDB88807.1 formyltetrahydrofolate deformylase [Nitrososphaerota archaeon]NDB46293.1 formyltetrahydrofolate deformylase [Nitrososphaeria archaeon]NDB89848.1 formyltetrahydrofolate deformylase [Nitrososphaerota archaeon]
MKKIRIGITVVGKDREGVVAAFTNLIFQKQGNIEKINQNVIKSLFGMHLEASFSKEIDIKKFDQQLQDLGKQFSMEVSVYHEINSNKNIAIFVTKEPHCLEAIIAAKSQLKGKISVIVGTEKTLESIAKKAGIPFVLVDEKEQQKAEDHLIDVTKKYDIDLVVLARYMRIMTPNFVWRYPHRIINIHPSLLPAFPGASAYAQAFERGAKIVGVTAHYVTEELDQGPIIFQDSFKVDSADTLETIKKKGQELEATTLLKAVKMHLEGKLEVSWRKVYIK